MPSIKQIIILAFATAVAAQQQISDGQVQIVSPLSVSTVPAVAQITDGQIQAVTTTAAAVKQITDGQIQVATAASTGAPVPTSNGTFTAVSPSATHFTGAAPILGWSQEMAVLAVGAAGAVAML
ncbi:hypothetical protein MMC28_007444 [Mycoblastus sanguinarius]|nr:hypothetical protein [Mycoblastus sanguinarius]